MDNDELFDNLKVVKRSGKKVDFDGAKIALAIKKGFDNIVVQDEEIDTSKSYTEKDIQKVYQAVINRIVKEYKNEDKIKIEDIQDMIEDEMEKKGYHEVSVSFKEYRERRAQSREMFVDDKRKHKFSYS